MTGLFRLNYLNISVNISAIYNRVKCPYFPLSNFENNVYIYTSMVRNVDVGYVEFYDLDCDGIYCFYYLDCDGVYFFY